MDGGTCPSPRDFFACGLGPRRFPPAALALKPLPGSDEAGPFLSEATTRLDVALNHASRLLGSDPELAGQQAVEILRVVAEMASCRTGEDFAQDSGDRPDHQQQASTEA